MYISLANKNCFCLYFLRILCCVLSLVFTACEVLPSTGVVEILAVIVIIVVYLAT